MEWNVEGLSAGGKHVSSHQGYSVWAGNLTAIRQDGFWATLISASTSGRSITTITRFRIVVFKLTPGMIRMEIGFTFQIALGFYTL